MLSPRSHSRRKREYRAPIASALARACDWQRLRDEGRVARGDEIARQEGLDPTTVWGLLHLTPVSLEVVLAPLSGRQAKAVTFPWLKNHELPADREAQQDLVGGLTGSADSMRHLPSNQGRAR